MKKVDPIYFEEVSDEQRQQYRKRQAARAVVRDKNGNIALLDVTKHNYHKLPGGGIKEGESEIEALRRECLEEIGCDIKIGKKIDFIVEEYRDGFKIHQESVCFLATVQGEKGAPDFTEKEISWGFEIIWVPPGEVIKILENDKPNDYQGKFIQKRDLLFLKEALGK